MKVAMRRSQVNAAPPLIIKLGLKEITDTKIPKEGGSSFPRAAVIPFIYHRQFPTFPRLHINPEAGI